MKQAEDMKRRMEAMGAMREKADKLRTQRKEADEVARKSRERDQLHKVKVDEKREIAVSKEKRAQRSRVRTHKISARTAAGNQNSIPPPPKGGLRKKASMQRIAREVMSGIKKKKNTPAPPPSAGRKKGDGPPPPPPPTSSAAAKGPPPPPPNRAPQLKVHSLSQLQQIFKASEENENKEVNFHGLKLACLEMYMGENEFTTAFGVKREEFARWPAWKKKSARKEHGIGKG